MKGLSVSAVLVAVVSFTVPHENAPYLSQCKCTSCNTVTRTTLDIKRNKTRKTGGTFHAVLDRNQRFSQLQFGGNKQEWIGRCGKNKRLKSIVKTKKR
jgi:hypothetical protein